MPRRLLSILFVVSAVSEVACAPPPLSLAGAHVAFVERPATGCSLVASVHGAAGYNGRSGETNAADVQTYLRNQAAERGADTLVLRSRHDGARSEGDSLSQPRGAASSGGCPNCVSMTAEAYRCAPTESAKPEVAAAPPVTAVASGGEPAFADAAAEAAMSAAMASAKTCKKPDDPSGDAQVMVTFAVTGDVVYSEVSAGPFVGTPTGECIARKFRNARVPPFAGAARSLTATVRLGS